METKIPAIKLYGAQGCHKTNYYKLVLDEIALSYTFLDVEANKDHAEGLAKVDYQIKDGKMFLVHSEVPYNLRGQGIGKVLVEKTFEKLNKEEYKAVAVCSYIKAVKNRSDYWRGIIE